jgi:opacity protein-like surface antigen
MLIRRIPNCLALGTLLLVAAAAQAQQTAPTQASARNSPRWNYEFRGAYFRPDLELFETFYGDDASSWGGALSYRLSDRLEIGGEYGLMKEEGVGLLTESAELGGSVDYRLDQAHVFANVIFQRSREQRIVPYVGAGLLVMRYEQEIEFQPDIDGRTDLGWSARAGVRFRVASHGPEAFRESSDSSPYWRAYVFLEAQEMSAQADGVELGGESLLLGFRMEFDMR